MNCRPDDLTPEQSARVQLRRRAVNRFLCTYSLVGCVPDLLTEAERADIAATRAVLVR